MRARFTRCSAGFRIDYDAQREDVPVYIAAITPRSIQQTGEIADGIYPIHWPKRAFQGLRRQLSGASRDAGRPEDSVTIAPFTNVYVLGEGDDEETWRRARQPLFHYTNRMGEFYWQMLSRSGFESDIAQSRAAWAERDSEGALMAFSEQMVREIQVIGPIGEVRELLQERSAAGAELQMLPMPQGSVSEGRRAPRTVSWADAMANDASEQQLQLEVEYCADCGYWPRASWMLGEIMADIQHLVSDVKLVPGTRGVFEWSVNGELVFSKAAIGRFPDLDELKELVYAYLD